MNEEDAVLIMVDDDEDDQLIAREAFEEIGLKARLVFLDNGQSLVDYLQGNEPYADREHHPMPSMVMLDINMPRMNGLEVLEYVKADSVFKSLPIVVLTNSGDPETIRRCYEMGASSYIRKPLEYAELKKALDNIRRYWFETVSFN